VRGPLHRILAYIVVGLFTIPSCAPRQRSSSVPPSTVLALPAPIYPRVLRNVGVEGNVEITVSVDSTGRTTENQIRVLASAHELFSTAVVRSVSRWRFPPADEPPTLRFAFRLVDRDPRCNAIASDTAADATLSFQFDEQTHQGLVRACGYVTVERAVVH